jgi:hydroxyethylthiazole kinase-like uncharacterized protein yjeF
VQQPAAARSGLVYVVDIGVAIPETAVRQAEESDIARWWPVPCGGSDKYSRGVVAMDVGSQAYQGAAILGVTGALHAGAGMVRYTGRVAGGLILTRHPSVVLGDGRAQAAVLGSGWGDDDQAAGRVAHARQVGLPAVIDADALYALPNGRLDGWLLTPHAGELSRMLGCSRAHVEADPISCAREVARSTGATVLLKGATQYVAEPAGRVTIAVAGPHWTAQAGSGDVLSGVCGALLAAGLPGWKAAVVGASIQAMTAAQPRSLSAGASGGAAARDDRRPRRAAIERFGACPRTARTSQCSAREPWFLKASSSVLGASPVYFVPGLPSAPCGQPSRVSPTQPP